MVPNPHEKKLQLLAKLATPLVKFTSTALHDVGENMHDFDNLPQNLENMPPIPDKKSKAARQP